jgi:subtilisin family serine protease/subtilisin-like proprotein convertase family protein
MRNYLLAVSLSIIIGTGLVACGGGGGGGGSSGGNSSSSNAPPAAMSDPLLAYQWHIQNTGGFAFSSILPVAGNDMNVTGAWAAGYTGKGIKVAIVDSGLEIAHEDLSANVDQANSHNFLTGTNNPTPTVAGEDHGTQVAGIIGAVGFNGKGGRGVAYNATLRGYNLFAPGVNMLSNIGYALGGASYSSGNDIFNESFGSAYGSLPPTNSTYQAVTAQTMTLRGGKGAALVQAAGNEFLSSNTSKCTNANNYKVSCGDPATDTRRDGYVPIIVGAFNADGVKSSYSNAGTSIWVSAPGGEYGFDSTYLSNLSAVAYKPAIITTSLDGCSNASAYGSTKILNSLNSQGQNANATNCQYTAIMNGTSSATPNVAAVIALMLESNPNLSVRDIKHILAKTAKKIDSTNTGVSSTSILPGSTVVLDQGWVKNAANNWFSTWYGFGAVDATAAVTMSKTYNAYLPAVQTNSSTLHYLSATTIPHNTSGVTMTFSMSQSFTTVEQIILFTNLTTTSALTCNQFEVTSPAGTKSILLHAANGYSYDGVNYQWSINNARLLSNAFYGESAAGDWTVRFLDFCSTGTTTFASTDNQTLSIIGH